MSASRTCLACKHFYFDGGGPTYSDLTPGSGATLSCRKNVWEGLGEGEFSQQCLYEALQKGADCDLFELADYAREKPQKMGRDQ